MRYQGVTGRYVQKIIDNPQFVLIRETELRVPALFQSQVVGRGENFPPSAKIIRLVDHLPISTGS